MNGNPTSREPRRPSPRRGSFSFARLGKGLKQTAQAQFRLAYGLSKNFLTIRKGLRLPLSKVKSGACIRMPLHLYKFTKGPECITESCGTPLFRLYCSSHFCSREHW